MAHTLDHIAAERVATATGDGLFGTSYQWLTPEELAAYEPGQEWVAYGRSGEAFYPEPPPGERAAGGVAYWKTEEWQEGEGFRAGWAAPGQPGFFLLPEAGRALFGTLGDLPGAAAGLTSGDYDVSNTGYLVAEAQADEPQPAAPPPPVDPGLTPTQQQAHDEQSLLDALGSGADYVSDLPGELGEATGEFFAELGAGLGLGLGGLFGGATAPITAAPGDLLKGIPIWAPLLAGAYLLFGGKK